MSRYLGARTKFTLRIPLELHVTLTRSATWLGVPLNDYIIKRLREVEGTYVSAEITETPQTARQKI
jgi:predicted HicB family RNase H-like nuclease